MLAIYRLVLTASVLVGASFIAPAWGRDGDSSSPDHSATADGDDVRVNEFLSYDADTKTAKLRLVAAYDDTNGKLNFNGGANGDHAVIIPEGWALRVSFSNQDGALPHSAIVVERVTPIPVLPPEPAFARAYSMKVEEGLTKGATDEIAFPADRAGDYWILCGVPGHGARGMYIDLVVSAAAKVPTYEM